MRTDKKQQQQIILLVVVVAIILALIVGFYWQKLLPVPVSDGTLPQVAKSRLHFNSVNYKSLLEREDFQTLEAFGDVPVKVPTLVGNPRPFVSAAEAEGRTEKK